MILNALSTLAWWAYMACALYLLILVVTFARMLVVATRENRLHAREARVEDFDTLLTSPFTIPVSIIAPAYNEEPCIVGSVRSLLTLEYPEYEVIVVNDGSAHCWNGPALVNGWSWV